MSTLEEYRAKAMLLGMKYNQVYHVFVKDESTPAMSRMGPFLDADTMEVLATDLHDNVGWERLRLREIERNGSE